MRVSKALNTMLDILLCMPTIGKRLHISVSCSLTPAMGFFHAHAKHTNPSAICAAGWWFKPEYIINQLNIQSVISSPAHDEELTSPPETAYTMKGYVYTGI